VIYAKSTKISRGHKTRDEKENIPWRPKIIFDADYY
jgi:hypothetical protein